MHGNHAELTESALLPVSIVAADPVLEAGTASALLESPFITVVAPPEPAAVVVVVTDAADGPALELARRLRDQPGRPEVVLAAADFSAAQALHAMMAGARGLVRRAAGADGLARAVHAAAGGDCTIPPDLLAALAGRAGAGDTTPLAAGAGVPCLTERERTVLRLIADGLETGEIARELSYSARTVTTIVHVITQRLRVRNRAHAVAYALRTGQI